jgi:hypothetical protein
VGVGFFAVFRAVVVCGRAVEDFRRVTACDGFLVLRWALDVGVLDATCLFGDVGVLRAAFDALRRGTVAFRCGFLSAVRSEPAGLAVSPSRSVVADSDRFRGIGRASSPDERE